MSSGLVISFTGLFVSPQPMAPNGQDRLGTPTWGQVRMGCPLPQPGQDGVPHPQPNQDGVPHPSPGQDGVPHPGATCLYRGQDVVPRSWDGVPTQIGYARTGYACGRYASCGLPSARATFLTDLLWGIW